MCAEVKRKNVWATHSTAKTPFRGRNVPVDLPTLHHEQNLPDVPDIAERVPLCGDQSCLLVKTSSSEIHLHRHLDLPHRCVVEQARDDARAGRTDRGPRTGKLWVIERVEELELQLVFEPLAEPGVLHQRHVGLGLPWIAKDATARISVCTSVVGSRPEGGEIEPMVGSGV